MGLDMYLTKRTYVGNEHRDAKKRIKISIPKGDFVKIDNKRVSDIVENVGYWRKANHIHKWFVDNVQNGDDTCKEYYVSREQLGELLEVCRKVLANSVLVDGMIVNGQTFKDGQFVPIEEKGKTISDPSVAMELLPAVEGFFFGGQEYDEYYLNDVERTKEMLEKLIEEESGDFYYQSSW